MKKNILFFVKTFNADKQKWLTDELIYEFSKTHKCTIFCIDRKNEWKTGKYQINDSIELIVFSLKRKKNKIKTLFDLYYHSRVFFFQHIAGKSFDLLIEFSIFSYFWGLGRKLKKEHRVKKSFGILWDFFPIHQVQTGHISKHISKILYFFEKKEVLSKDLIFLMSEQNITFFNNYYPKHNCRTEILYIWSDEEKEVKYNNVFKMDKNKLNIVFGGQLEKGRGIESIINSIVNSTQLENKVSLYIIGDGRLKSRIEKQIQNSKNIHLLPPMSRSEYLGFLASCDIGLVTTVPNVSIPSFPSKILDYLYMSKLVIASTESSSDFGQYVENKIACGYNVTAGDSESFIKILNKVYYLKYNDNEKFIKLGANGRKFFQRYMTTKIAVKKIVNTFEG